MTATKQITCVDYYDESFQSSHDNMIQDGYWGDSYSTDKAFESMQRSAKNEGFTLTDADTWNHDKFLYDEYKNVEKGLS